MSLSSSRPRSTARSPVSTAGPGAAGLGEAPLEQLARRRAASRQHPAGLAQASKSSARAGERMAGACDHRHAIFEKLLLLEVVRPAALRSVPRMKSTSPLRSDAASTSYGLSTVASEDRDSAPAGTRWPAAGTSCGPAAGRPRRRCPAAAFAGRDVGADVAQLVQHPLEVEREDLAGGRGHQARAVRSNSATPRPARGRAVPR